MSSAPPGVARRLHQTPLRAPARAAKPPGAFRANLPNRAGPGLLRPGRRLRERRARPRPPPPTPPSYNPRPPYLRLRPARPPPDGLHSERPRAARPDPTRPRPRSPRVGEEERRLRNRQPPPVPPPRPPVFPASSGPRAAAAAVTNRSAAWRTTRSPLEMGSSTSQSQAVCRREAGARRNGRGGRGSTGAGWRRARWFPP